MIRGYLKAAMYMTLVTAVLFVTAGGSLAADKDKAPAKGPRAIINTKFGEIEIEFFQDKAPKFAGYTTLAVAVPVT